MAVQTFISLVAGVKKVVAAINASAGAADEGKIPALNADGVLDPSITNATESATAGTLVQRDGSGRIPAGSMPVGIGADIKSLEATEALAAGNLINVYDVGGVAKMRKADGSTTGKTADGFVLAAVTSGNNGDAYFEGTNNQLAGLTPGVRYYLSGTAGGVTPTPLTGAGKTHQYVGKALSATELSYEGDDGIELN